MSGLTVSRRQFLKAAAGGAALATLAACAPATTSPSAAVPASETATVPVAAGSKSLSVGYAQGTSFSHFMHIRHFAGSEAIYSKRFANAKLITLDNAAENFVPDLAESWVFSDDGLQLTFKLREGLTWHDGEPFTSEDVRVTFHMICLPTGSYVMGNNFAPYLTGFAEYIEGTADSIAGMTIEDAYTVSFELMEPFAEYLLLLAFNGITIAPAHFVSSYMDREKSEELLQSEWATTEAHVGIGPFRVVEYVPDQYVIYEPFENYYRGKPLLDQLIYRPYKDAQTLTAAFENQEIDVAARIPPTEYERLQALDFAKYELASSPSISGLNMNNRQPYLNAQVRAALLHAIDRETICSTLYAGVTEPIHSPIRVPGIPDSPNLTKYEYDPDKARQLLEEGGWDSSRALRWAVSAVPSDTTFPDVIMGYWNNIGVQTEYQVYGADATGISSEPFDFDVISSAWPLGYPSQIAVHYDTRSCTRWCVGQENDRLLELFDAARYQMSQDEFQAIIWEMQDIISAEAQFLWISQSPDIWGMQKKVQGLKPSYTPYEFTYNDWDLEKVDIEV